MHERYIYLLDLAFIDYYFVRRFTEANIDSQHTDRQAQTGDMMTPYQSSTDLSITSQMQESMLWESLQ